MNVFRLARAAVMVYDSRILKIGRKGKKGFDGKPVIRKISFQYTASVFQQQNGVVTQALQLVEVTVVSKVKNFKRQCFRW